MLLSKYSTSRVVLFLHNLSMDLGKHLLSWLIIVLQNVKLKVRLPYMKSEMKYFHCPVLRWLSPSRHWIDIPSVDYIYEDEEGCVSFCLSFTKRKC